MDFSNTKVQVGIVIIVLLIIGAFLFLRQKNNSLSKLPTSKPTNSVLPTSKPTNSVSSTPTPRSQKTPSPIDCTVSNWIVDKGSSCQPCNENQDSGKIKLSRSIVTPSKNGGSPCPSLTGERECACPPKPIPRETIGTKWTVKTTPSCNGGTYVNELIGCLCLKGWTGKNCETRSPCNANGVIENGVCKCDIGYWGEKCENTGPSPPPGLNLLVYGLYKNNNNKTIRIRFNNSVDDEEMGFGIIKDTINQYSFSVRYLKDYNTIYTYTYDKDSLKITDNTGKVFSRMPGFTG